MRIIHPIQPVRLSMIPPGPRASPESRFDRTDTARRVRIMLYFFFALREREPPLARSRAIWARGRVTQISPIQSSFTPLIGLALKLARLTVDGDFPRSIVFR